MMSEIFNVVIVFVSISCRRKLCVTSLWPPSLSSTLSPTRSATQRMDRYVSVRAPSHFYTLIIHSHQSLPFVSEI